ncbi:hypothetical protein [Zavarzinella formosa]|uniref:hypothetical protein n=1 Tax=Zavarzinella formosa TaxID=360055 RepID=UPI0002D64058|nr:hypothetical protein [Zavarzinella formosa]
MGANASESFLHSLAQRTFLKLWSVPNPFRTAGKEISDLVIVFGDDIVIFSDKACEFRSRSDLQTAWGRWRREAIDGSVAQLSGAFRRLSGSDATIFLDAKGESRLPYPLPPRERRRFHLVAIARPSEDPATLPHEWHHLTCVSEVSGIPFEVEPIRIGELPVHVFDGQAIDLLLTMLDTAPDFIAYLEGRAEALATSASYRFVEEDLLAISIQNWAAGSGLSPAVPALTSVVKGRWAEYQKSGRAGRSTALNTNSRTVDRIIEHFHEVFEQQLYVNESAPGILEHEHALRLLAAESRFSRRMVVTPLYDILQEHNQSVPWTSTVPSPREPSLRYLWLIYPDPPLGMDPDSFVRLVDAQLRHQTLVICGEFRPSVVVAVALPNGKGNENVVIMRVFDGSNWTDDDRREAQRLKEMGLFGSMTATDYLHRP